MHNPRPPLHAIPTSSLDASGVKICLKGDFGIKWKRPGECDHRTQLLASAAKPGNVDDLRFVRFTEHGISVVNKDNEPFLTGSRKAQRLATMPTSYFDSHRDGAMIWALWTAVRTHLGFPPSVKSDIDPQARKWPGAPGVKLVTNVKKENPLQNRSPELMDQNWLLVKYLDEVFPDGIASHTAAKSTFPDSTEDLQEFVAMLKQPEYILHPYLKD